MSLTTDPNDPRLKRGGADTVRVSQNEVYLVLSEEERAKGFVRPVRDAYIHVGLPKPTRLLRELNEQERGWWGWPPNVNDVNAFVAFEAYPPEAAPKTGRYWTQAQLDSQGCGTRTTMGRALAETYARDPRFYGATYCCCCARHLLVGEFGEFVWEDGSRVGT